MPSSDSFVAPEVSPWTLLEQLLHGLLASFAHLVIGIAIGLVAARLLRARGLHWSWATLALVPLVISHAPPRGAAAALGLGALGAALWGRRWHQEDIDAGRDLCEMAAARRSPPGVMGSLVRMALLRRRMRRDGEWLLEDELILGRDRANRLVAVPFGGVAGGTHALVLGATGSGKTMTQSWMAARAIEAGMGAVIIDPKGDRGLREAIRDSALSSSREFVEWSPQGPCVYNPYARGSDTEIADKILAGERFTEPHYLRQAQRYLGHVVRTLRGAGLDVSLASIVAQLDPSALERLARTLPEQAAAATHAYLDSLTPRQRLDLAGVRDRMAILAESDIGGWLDPQTADGRPFLVMTTRSCVLSTEFTSGESRSRTSASGNVVAMYTIMYMATTSRR